MKLKIPFSNFLKRSITRPNGYDKDWNKLYIAVYGFRTCFNSWPTKVYLPKKIIENLQYNFFSHEAYSKLESKLKFILSDNGIMAEDDFGNRFRYGKDKFINDPPNINVYDWLNVTSVN